MRRDRVRAASGARRPSERPVDRARSRVDTGTSGTLALIGQSAALQALRRRVQRVATTEASVLILGERGTGKELVAGAIHQAGPRRGRPFLAVNCAALPADLLAAELFGHARGAFTGATQRREGLLVAAAGGTVFLDEIGDLPPAGQAMLLRFLQEREVRAVGTTETMTVDVRIIAATNRDLATATAAGAFRADLRDRLSEAVLAVPPLRARREDIRLLAAHFLGIHGARHRRPGLRLAPAALDYLEAQPWPGNVRELEKAISSAVIFSENDWIQPDDLDLDREPGAETAPAADVTARQRKILELAGWRGPVRRGDLSALLGLSGEAVRQELVALLSRGLLEREGTHRWTRYRLPARRAADTAAASGEGDTSPSASGISAMPSRSSQPMG